MKLTKAERRENKRNKKKKMKVSGASVKQLAKLKMCCGGVNAREGSTVAGQLSSGSGHSVKRR